MTRTNGGSLVFRIAPYVTMAILAGPLAFALMEIGFSAFGHLRLYHVDMTSLDAFTRVLSEPGIGTSLWLGFWIGPATALIALTLVALFAAAWTGTRWFAAVLALIKPVLAVPHAAAAFGLAVLIAPSGFLLRLVSPQLTGFVDPPDWLVVNDPAGFAMLAGLVLKEIAFLLLVLIAALPQADERRARFAVGAGYGRVWAWLVAVFPAVYRQIRLPVYAVIAFATSVVDVAIVLGPVTPPPLAVRILHWMNDPDLSMRSLAAAAALIQFGLTLLALGIWFVGEMIVSRLGRRLALSGRRLSRDRALRALGLAGIGGAALLVLGGIALLALSSLSGPWRFPHVLPQSLTLATWMREAPNLLKTASRAVVIGTWASAISLFLVLACLENEYRTGRGISWRGRILLYLPLLVPQITFLPGLTLFFLVAFGPTPNLALVIFAHLIFVLPYTYLTLADPWNAFDTRYLDIARALGKNAAHALLTVRLPILLRPILTAFALGFAISVAQYLPTLLVGGGRLPTITTEAVALASGGNRRLIGVYGLTQTLLPFVVFSLSAILPTLLWRNRRALRPGAGW